MNETLFPEYEDIKPILQIGSYFIGKYKKVESKKKRGGGERASIIKEFIDEINKERYYSGFEKEVSPKMIAVKLGILKTNQELYEFLSECRDYKNRHGSFGKRFFGGFKEKLDKDTIPSSIKK